MWLAFKQSNGKYGVCQETNLPHLIVIGVEYVFLHVTDDPMKACNHLLGLGISDFDQSYVNAFCNGHNRPWREPKPIICNQTGVVYGSINQACTHMGLHCSNVSKHLLGKKGFRTVKGYTFKYHVGE